MPHVIVKLWPGKTREQKQQLTDAIVREVMSTLNYSEDAISVGFEEVSSGDWTGNVVEPDLLGKWGSLVKKPGYIHPRDSRRS